MWQTAEFLNIAAHVHIIIIIIIIIINNNNNSCWCILWRYDCSYQF